MRIDLGAILPQALDPSQGPKPGARPVVSEGHPGGDTAKLSQGRGRIDELASQVSQFPEIRQEKVAALRQAIEHGSYQVPAGKAAEALISSMQVHPAA